MADQTAIQEQIEARIGELTRARSEALRASLEKSIVGLEERGKEAEERMALVNHTISELETLVSESGNLFSEYRARIQDVLGKEGNEQKIALKSLLSSLILEEKHIKIALCSVHHRGPISAVSALAPPEGLEPPT